MQIQIYYYYVSMPNKSVQFNYLNHLPLHQLIFNCQKIVANVRNSLKIGGTCLRQCKTKKKNVSIYVFDENYVSKQMHVPNDNNN